jgi:hypothetical protein
VKDAENDWEMNWLCPHSINLVAFSEDDLCGDANGRSFLVGFSEQAVHSARYMQVIMVTDHRFTHHTFFICMTV